VSRLNIFVHVDSFKPVKHTHCHCHEQMCYGTTLDWLAARPDILSEMSPNREEGERERLACIDI